MTKGIDVSRYQGKINFEKVKKSGIDFVIIRAGTGYGSGSEDALFEENYKAAKAAGLKVGCYFYSYAMTPEDAKTEAIFLQKLIKNKTFDYPVAYDIEEAKFLATGSKNVMKTVEAFMNNIPVDCSIYCNKYWADTLKLKDTDYKLWVAQWNDKNTYNGKYYMWQYSDNGKVDGISGAVDMNYCVYEPKKTEEPKININGYSSIELAKMVWEGKFGNGEQRKKLLGNRYAEVQALVNKASSYDDFISKAANRHNKGSKVVLKDVALYGSATGKMVKRISGTYYIYDGLMCCSRFRITNSPENVGKTPIGQYVTGFIEAKDILI